SCHHFYLCFIRKECPAVRNCSRRNPHKERVPTGGLHHTEFKEVSKDGRRITAEPAIKPDESENGRAGGNLRRCWWSKDKRGRRTTKTSNNERLVCC
ncbi:unnamed protein product, partial [Ectocarpus sp. 8 AP-2014]